MKKKIVFLTLAKENSNRLKNKNILSFAGKPLIYWTINKIKKISDEHYINTDSEFILRYAEKLNVKTIFRKPELRGDAIPSRHLMLDSFKYFPKNSKMSW
jgi:CMP-N-acetylneuraminic acid synthetase